MLSCALLLAVVFGKLVDDLALVAFHHRERVLLLAAVDKGGQGGFDGLHKVRLHPGHF